MSKVLTIEERIDYIVKFVAELSQEHRDILLQKLDATRTATGLE